MRRRGRALRRRYGRARAKTRTVEGVTHTLYRVRFSGTNGKRYTARLWSPGRPWLDSEIRRYLDDRGGVDHKKPVLVEPA